MTAPDVNADVRARLPELPESGWNGDNRYDWLGNPFEYTERKMRDYGEACYRAAHADLAGEVRELVEAAEEVCRISDRKHDAWDRLKAAIAKFHPTHQETK